MYLALVLGVLLDQTAEGLEAVRQTLGIIQPVDADGEGAVRQAFGNPQHLLVALGAYGVLGEALGIDADRIGEGAHPAPGQPDPLTVDRGAQQALRAVAKVARMFLGLEAHDVVGAEIGHQLARHRHGFEHRRRHERDVQEETDATFEALLAQQAGEGDEMVVMRPHRVVALQQRRQRRGEGAIDREVAFVILATEMHQPQAEVQQRPQRPVGEADVEAAIGVGRQVDRGIGDAARLDDGRCRGLRGETTAPPEPHRAGGQQVAQRNGQAARSRAPRLGNGHAVGDDYEACHSPSSQLRESRMADRIRPTWL